MKSTGPLVRSGYRGRTGTLRVDIDYGQISSLFDLLSVLYGMSKLFYMNKLAVRPLTVRNPPPRCTPWVVLERLVPGMGLKMVAKG